MPEPYRTWLLADNGKPLVYFPGDSQREVVLYDLRRLVNIHGMFREAYGAAAAGILNVAITMGGVTRLAVNKQGQVLDMFDEPSAWRAVSDSLAAFLARVERDGIDWIGEHRA